MRVQDRTPERLGPYRLVRRIGEGGMGVVYLALDDAGEQVAVKALHPGLAQEGNARRRMGREVETMRLVRSPHVAEVLDADLDGDPPFIVTRYVPGLTLDAVVSAGGPLTGPALARLACGLAEALAAVHAAGVVHRDLKPGNVMISDGEPVVIDFGIAQLHETTRLTMTGMFMGTPGYLAPEVIEGKDSGTASDVHSWGATVAFAATGRPPFGTGPFEGIFYRIMQGSPDLDTLPDPLREVVLAALSRDPAGRPAASELGSRVSSIDPAMLVPSPAASVMRVGGLTAGADGFGGGAGAGLAGLAGSAGGPGPAAAGELPRTLTDGRAGPGQDRLAADGLAEGGLAEGWLAEGWPMQGWPTGSVNTRPLATSSQSDVADLLPPVSFRPAAVAARPGDPADGFRRPGADGGAGGFAGGAPGGVGLPGGAGPAGTADAGSGRTVGPISAWSPLVIATVAMVVAVSVMAPIIGTAIALGVLVALRAAATTARQLARRRAGDDRGAAASAVPLLAVALYPLALLRAVLGLLLVLPVALLAFCVAAAAAIIAIPVHPLPQAVALGAGALVAVIGLGPGSAGSRAVLARLYTSATRSPSLLAVAYVGVLAIAVWAGVSAWYQSPAPAYWPIRDVHVQILHFPAIHTMLTDVRQNLLRLARQIGL